MSAIIFSEYYYYYYYFFRKVTSQPFSRVFGNRWYGYQVCSVEVLVKGPCQRFPEVRDALSGTPLCRLLLKRCTPHVSKPTQQTTLPTPLTSTPLTLATYASTSHTPMTHTLMPTQDNDSDDSDSTIVYELPQPDMDILNISNKNTERLDVYSSDSDATVLPSQHDSTEEPFTDLDFTPPLHGQSTHTPPLFTDSDSTPPLHRQSPPLFTDSDSTPPLHRQSPPLFTDSDSTPPLHRQSPPLTESDSTLPLRQSTYTPPYTHFTDSDSTPPIRGYNDSDCTPPLPGQKRKRTVTKHLKKTTTTVQINIRT